MKATIEFNLDDPGERYAHKCALSAQSIQSELLELDNDLRSIWKYDKGSLGDVSFEDVYDLARLVRIRLLEGIFY